MLQDFFNSKSTQSEMGNSTGTQMAIQGQSKVTPRAIEGLLSTRAPEGHAGAQGT